MRCDEHAPRGADEKCIQSISKNQKGRDYMSYLKADVKIILSN
jgi:hypothetical protein